jgi:hypothetical protein
LIPFLASPAKRPRTVCGAQPSKSPALEGDGDSGAWQGTQRRGPKFRPVTQR